MPIATSTSVVLKFDIPEYGLKTGDVGTIVHVYDQAEAYEIEFVSLNGLRPLKTICARGGPRGAKASPEAMPAVREYVKSIRDSVSRYRDYSQLGSSGDLLELNEMGLLGTRNYRSMQLEGAERIDGRNLKSYVVRNITCPRCVVHCKAEVELKEGKYKDFRGGRPEYETVIDLGALCGLTDPEALMYLSNLCNILWVDTISTVSVITFAMDLYDRKILSREQTD